MLRTRRTVSEGKTRCRIEDADGAVRRSWSAAVLCRSGLEWDANERGVWSCSEVRESRAREDSRTPGRCRARQEIRSNSFRKGEPQGHAEFRLGKAVEHGDSAASTQGGDPPPRIGGYRRLGAFAPWLFSLLLSCFPNSTPQAGKMPALRNGPDPERRDRAGR
jgi:hypothetical protein